MERIAEHGTCRAISAPPTLALSKQSHVITKTLNPKIRIIHIFAPEVIKTDAANFRELVQRLTGMGSSKKKAKGAASTNFTKEPWRNMGKSSDLSGTYEQINSACGLVGVKEEGGRVWGGESCSVFGGLDDLDGFIQELDEFPVSSSLRSAK